MTCLIWNSIQWGLCLWMKISKKVSSKAEEGSSPTLSHSGRQLSVWRFICLLSSKHRALWDGLDFSTWEQDHCLLVVKRRWWHLQIYTLFLKLGQFLIGRHCPGPQGQHKSHTRQLLTFWSFRPAVGIRITEERTSYNPSIKVISRCHQSWAKHCCYPRTAFISPTGWKFKFHPRRVVRRIYRSFWDRGTC